MFRVLLFVAILAPGWAFSQYKISGLVIDQSSGAPLQGANVYSADKSLGTTTDAEGAFELQNVPSGTFELFVSFVGFQSFSVKLDVSADTYREIGLVPSKSLEEVVIKGIRAGEDSPVSQKTISKKEIEAVYIGQDASFLLERLTPSLVAYSESGTGLTNYSQIRLRGIDQTRINITLNGAPLNDMIDQGVFFSNFTDFGNSIESVQVQRGVGTSTNGTASYAGSISFESVNLNDPDPSFELQLLSGSFNTHRASAEVKTGLMENKLSFYSRFTGTTSDGYRFNSGTNSYSFFFSGGYFGERDLIKVTAFTGRTRNELAYLPVFIDDILAEPRTNPISPNDVDNFGQQFVQLQHTRWFNDDLSLTSSFYYGGAGGDFPVGLTEDGTFRQLNFPLFNDHFGVTSNVDYQASGKLNISGGLHAYTFRRINEESFFPDLENPFYEDESQKDEISLFGKANYDLGAISIYADVQVRRVTLDLDVEDDIVGAPVNIPLRDWTFVNPKIGVVFPVDDKIDLFASYGRSGREPTRFDLLGNTSITVDNLAAAEDVDAVQPEYINDLEIGGRWKTGSFSGSANFFYTQFENEISPIGELILGFIQLRENIANSRRSGVEIDWQWRPSAKLAINGNTTFMSSQIEEFTFSGSNETFTDVEPILTPDLIFNATVEYKPVQSLLISLSGRHVGESFLELTNREDLILPSFFVANAQVAYEFNKHVSLSFLLNNIFDEQYFTFGVPIDNDFDGTIDGPGYLIQPPRHFYGSLKVKF